MKKRKIFKTLAFSSLAACMFCLPILAGCAPAEMLPQKPTQGQNFDLGLNPETDPVVYTTASGLQIKKSDGKYSSTTTVATNTGYTVTQDLTSFYYFTMGKFSGTIYTAKTQTDTYTVTNEPVNWLIIGRGEMPVADNTPAGSAIQGDAGKQETAFSNSMYECVNFSSIPQHSDIPKGCFLVLSEKLLGQMYFNSSGAINRYCYTKDSTCNVLYSSGGYYGNRYRYYGEISTATKGAQSWNTSSNQGGDLYNYVNSLMSIDNSTGTIAGSNKLGFTQAQANLIVPQQLYTFYSNGNGYPLAETPSTDGTYYTMFPLAYRAVHSATKQNFCIDDYLKTQSQRVAVLIGANQSYVWGLRTGSDYAVNGVVSVSPAGVYINGSTDGVTTSCGVRPAMVMKLS